MEPGVLQEFIIISRLILDGIRKVSYKAVAKTKVHVCCEVAVQKMAAERTPGHSWCTNSSQICDVVPVKYKLCTIIMNTYCFRQRTSLWLTGSQHGREEGKNVNLLHLHFPLFPAPSDSITIR